MSGTPMAGEILCALGMAVLERCDDGAFGLVAPPPEPLVRLGLRAPVDLMGSFPFLETFLADAEAFWNESGSRLDSDTWVQTAPDGRDYALQASAVHAGGRKLLVLRLLGAEYEQRQAAVQKARDTSLSYEKLGREAGKLETRNREMERMDRLKSEFLASMSHELRTPLNAIIGFSSLLAEERAGPVNAEQQKYVQHIRRGAHHLLELINDVLDLSRIEAGRLELHRETFNLAEALRQVLSGIRPVAERKRLRLETERAPDCRVYADRLRFRQILLNLLGNAIKFTPAGGEIAISCRVRDGELTISVSDTGMGIPPEEHAAIFEKFHQVGSSTRGVREGTGLGLAITKGLVEQHGGRIWVESRPRMGSRFIFTLPHAELLHDSHPGSETTGAHTAGPQSAPSGAGPVSRIAVVEDDPANRLVFQAMLAPPYDVTLYEDGQQALEGLGRETPDLVLLDIALPGMDGVEVLRRIRGAVSLRSVPVIAVSAHAMTGDRERFLSAGFDGYVAKPIAERSVLLGAIEPLLAGRPPLRPS